jgi:hypothetical protein
VIVLGQNLQSDSLLFEKMPKNRLIKENQIKRPRQKNAKIGELRKNRRSASSLFAEVDLNLSEISDNDVEKSIFSDMNFEKRFNKSGISPEFLDQSTRKSGKYMNLNCKITQKFHEESFELEQKFYQNYADTLNKENSLPNFSEVKNESICKSYMKTSKIKEQNVSNKSQKIFVNELDNKENTLNHNLFINQVLL